ASFCERFDPCEDEPPVGPCAHSKDPPLKTCDVYTDDEFFVFVPCHPHEAPKDVVVSIDPNDKVGPNDPGGFVDGRTALPYSVLFENLKTATAPAQKVAVTDQLDVAKLDLGTFNLGPIS